MKTFKFLTDKPDPRHPINEIADIPIPEWITETSHRILYLQGYWDASVGQPRLNELRRGLSEMGKDIYDAGYFVFYTNRTII